MEKTSARVLEEGSCDEKSTLILDRGSESSQSSPEPYAGIRDFLLVVVGISTVASIILLLMMLRILPHVPTSSFQNVPGAQGSCEFEVPPLFDRVLKDISIAGNKPHIRREWRALKKEEKLEFISAIHCLTRKPSKLGLQTTRYDDFVYVHVVLYDYSEYFIISCYLC